MPKLFDICFKSSIRRYTYY